MTGVIVASGISAQKVADNKVSETAERDFAVADRLRTAIAGFNRSTIAGKAGLSDRSLARALGGARVRRGTLVALAEALDVRKEWLIDGQGEMRGTNLTPVQVQTLASTIDRGTDLPDPGLRATVDMEVMGAAMRLLAESAAVRGDHKTWPARAKDLMLTYDFVSAFGVRFVENLLEMRRFDLDPPGEDG